MKHWHECWRYTSHHACAVAEVERLRATLDDIVEQTESDFDWPIRVAMIMTAARAALIAGEEGGGLT